MTVIIKGSFYIVQYPFRWTAKSALHFYCPRPVHSDTNSDPPGSILARQQLRATATSLTFPPLSIARYSFIQLSGLRHHGENEKMPKLRNSSKNGFEPGLT